MKERYSLLALLETVKKSPGLTSRGVRKAIGASQGMDETIRDRLFALAEQGKIRHEDEEAFGEVVARRWYPVSTVKE